MAQRPHKPHELGPRVYRKGRWWSVDLRCYGEGRPTMRNPRAPGWPKAGERTELEEIAHRWKWAYLDWCHGEHRDRVLGTKRDRLLKDAVAEYLELRFNTKARATFANDRTILRHLLADNPGAPVSVVKPRRTFTRLLRAKYAPYTLQTYSTYLAGFYRWLGVEYPAPELPRVPMEDVVTLTTEQIATVRQEADRVGMLVAVDLGLYVGLRMGEMAGAMGEDFDLATWTMRVHRQRLRSGTLAPLKGRRARTALILPGWTHPVPPGLLLGGKSYWSLDTGFKAVLKAAGIVAKGKRAHILRDTYARLFLEGKPEMRLLQASLGHSSVTTTERSYNAMLPDKAAEIARKAIHGA